MPILVANSINTLANTTIRVTVLCTSRLRPNYYLRRVIAIKIQYSQSECSRTKKKHTLLFLRDDHDTQQLFKGDHLRRLNKIKCNFLRVPSIIHSKYPTTIHLLTDRPTFVISVVGVFRRNRLSAKTSSVLIAILLAN